MDFSSLSNEAMRMANELQKKFDLVDAGNRIIPTATGGQIEINEFTSTSAVVKAMLLMRLTTEKVKCISILVVCRENTVIPHWTFEFVESSRPGASFMCFVDFLSRVDLGVELEYVNQVYMPLSPIKKELLAVMGDKPPMELQLIQRCCHSPWATALSFPNTAIEQVIPRFNKYFEHFLTLTNTSISNVARLPDDKQLDRDRKQRKFVYNIEVDPIWMMFRGVLGADATEQLLNSYLNLGFN